MPSWTSSAAVSAASRFSASLSVDESIAEIYCQAGAARRLI
jgi:hypothetical protein